MLPHGATDAGNVSKNIDGEADQLTKRRNNTCLLNESFFFGACYFFGLVAIHENSVMRHYKLKRKKMVIEGFITVKGEIIRQWGFVSFYGLLRAFRKAFICLSVMPNFHYFIISLFVTKNIDSSCDSNILEK